jgi:hypothetical protein
MDQALVTAAIEQAMKGMKSQELFFATTVIILSLGSMAAIIRIFMGLLEKRDDAIKELVVEVKGMNQTTNKIAELQNVDLAATSRNRDILQDIDGRLVRLDTCLTVLKSDVGNHVIECRQKVLKT